MSLKAKIEAVLYASEEPVTLPQLAGLLGVEAQAELDALDARQGSLLPLEASAPESEDGEAAEPDGIDLDALNAEALGDPALPPDEPRAGSAAQADAASGPSTLSVPVSAAAEASADVSGAQAKREARERERRLRDYFRELVEGLMADYANGDRGLEIREVAGGFRFATKPEFHDTVRGFVRSLKPPLKLSLQALETLAVVAYKQPVTAPEVNEIRGVDSGGVLGSLIARKLITTAGRKQVIGRPILYKTTKEFLLRFGLKDTSELPSIEEFERMAGELADAVQEEIDMEQDARSGSAIKEAGAPESHADSPPVDEINAAPEPAETLHESMEDLLADKGSAPGVVGSDAVEGRSPENGSSVEDTEAMRDVHEPQADGVPDSDAGSLQKDR